MIYEDDVLLCYDKEKQTNCDEAGLFGMLKQSFGKIFPVHRLDRDTTGLVLVAKTIAVQKQLEELFSSRKVIKEYLAVVMGRPKQQKGVIKNYLASIKKYSGGVVWGAVSPEKGKFAHTAWSIHERKGRHSTLLCQLYTGRTHQIRVHLSGMGFPVVGDKQYGGDVQLASRQLLHAWRLSFTHPVLGKQMNLVSPIPPDLHIL